MGNLAGTSLRPRRRRHSLLGIVVGLLALGVILTACNGSSNAGSGQIAGCDSKTKSIGQGAMTILCASDRKAPVQLAASTLTGTHLDVAGLRGKPVVINVWGSWCGPCRSEAPQLQAASVALKGQANFVGIDTLDDNASAQAFERHYAITYPSLVDKGTLLLQLHGAVTSKSPPVTVILDPQGRVAARFVGPVTKLTLVDMVSEVSQSA